MFRRSENQAEVEAVPLQRAVLCVDCESVSNSRGDKCPVCGSRSILNLGPMLGGTLAAHKASSKENENFVLYDLDISIELKQMGAGDLNAILRVFTDVIGARLGPNGASFHVNVEPVISSSAAPVKIA